MPTGAQKLRRLHTSRLFRPRDAPDSAGVIAEWSRDLLGGAGEAPHGDGWDRAAQALAPGEVFVLSATRPSNEAFNASAALAS